MLVNLLFRNYKSNHDYSIPKQLQIQQQYSIDQLSFNRQLKTDTRKKLIHQPHNKLRTQFKMPPKPPPAPVCAFCGSFMCMYQAQGRDADIASQWFELPFADLSSPLYRKAAPSAAEMISESNRRDYMNCSQLWMVLH